MEKSLTSIMDMITPTKIIITGFSGFVAHHLGMKLQEKGYFVVGVDKRPIPQGHSIPNEFIQTRVEDLGFRDLMGVKHIYHLAFITNIPNSVRHPIETTRDNIDMTIHLLQYAKEASVEKVLFPSTASLYSNNPTPWKEDMPPMPIEPYSWQKLACEYACQMYAKVYGLSTIIVRLFQVFGELQREDTALAMFIKAKREGKPIQLTETTAQSTFKSGQRDFIYAGDVAEAMIGLMESDKTGQGEIFNIGSGELRTMEEIVNALKAEVKWIPKRNYEVETHLADISKIKNTINWKPKVEVIKWLKSALIQ